MKKLISLLKSQNIRQFIKFGLVGGLNTGITVGSFYVLHNLLGLYYIAATIIAYSLGVINSYIWNKFWTFKIKDSEVSGEFAKFLVVNLIGMGLNTLFISVFVELIDIDEFVAQIFAVSVVMAINFIGSKFWVFRRKENK